MIKDKLAAYQRDFFAAATATQESAQAVAALAKIYADIEPQLSELDTR